MRINYLVIVRHGDYDEQRNLSEEGRKKMQGLAVRLHSLINGNKVLLFSSTAPRASQSAQVIAETLGLPFEEHEILWSEIEHPEDVGGLMAFVDQRKDEAEVIILVTHLEYAGRFPFRFARDVLAMTDADYAPIPLKGEACVIDCVKKNFSVSGSFKGLAKSRLLFYFSKNNCIFMVCGYT